MVKLDLNLDILVFRGECLKGFKYGLRVRFEREENSFWFSSFF